MATTITEFRKQFPQYNDVNDIDLAGKLHKKYYSDMPFETFAPKFLSTGRQISREQPEQVRGLEGAIGTALKEQPTLEAGKPRFRDMFREKILRPIGLGEARFGGPIEEFAKKKGKAFATGVKEEGPLFVGETVGEAIGSKFGAKGRIAGAAFGRAGADAYVQLAQQIIGSEKAPKTMKDAALRLVKEAAIGGGTELISEGVFRFARRVGGVLGFKATAIKPIPDLDDLNRLARSAGIDFLPAGRTTSRSIDTLEEIAENAFFGRGKIRDIKEIAHPAGVRRLVDKLMDAVLPRAQRVGRGELGELLDDAITKKNKSFRKAGSALYKRLDKITAGKIKKRVIKEPGVTLQLGKLTRGEIKRKVKREVGGAVTDLRPLKKFAQKLKTQRIKEGGTRKPIDTLIDDILSRPAKVNFTTAHNIRSDYLQMARGAPSSKDRIVGLAKKASAMTDKQMRIAASNLSGDAMKLWRAADAFWREGKTTFNSQVIKRVTKAIANETPDKVFEAVFQRKSPKQIRTIMSLADPLTQKRLRYAFLEDLMDKSMMQIPGDVSDLRTLVGKRFIDKFDTFGDETLNAIFPQEMKKNIRNVARVAKITQGKSGGAGGFLVQLMQAGPLAGVVGGMATGKPSIVKKSIGAAAQVSGFTYGLSRLLASRRGSKILTDMMTVPPRSPQFVALGVRLSRELLRIKLEDRRKQKLAPQAFRIQ